MDKKDAKIGMAVKVVSPFISEAPIDTKGRITYIYRDIQGVDVDFEGIGERTVSLNEIDALIAADTEPAAQADTLKARLEAMPEYAALKKAVEVYLQTDILLTDEHRITEQNVVALAWVFVEAVEAAQAEE